MLYIAAVPCGGGRAQQHDTAWDLLYRMLSALCDFKKDDIKYKSGGKPYLADNAVYFSLSHTEGAVCCAVSAEQKTDIGNFLPAAALLFTEQSGKMPVGVDIECVSVARDFSRIAKGFFTTDEIANFSRSKDKADAFYYIYTRKESAVKATGKGIGAIRTTASVLADENLHTYRLSFSEKSYIISVALCSVEKREENEKRT